MNDDRVDDFDAAYCEKKLFELEDSILFLSKQLLSVHIHIGKLYDSLHELRSKAQKET